MCLLLGSILNNRHMTSLSKNELVAEFQRNVDAIATELICAFSLKFKQEVVNLSDPLMRWLDFRYRYVDPQPRQVVFSKKFPKRNLPTSTKTALENVVRLIKKGGDINPYQGRGLTLRNDISGERNETRTDLLWADWGIHHFHLSNELIPSDRYYSRSADYLAFCLVGGNLVAFIDVLPHPDKEGFANPKLIHTVASNWPDYMKQFRLNGITPNHKYTQAEIHTLRTNGTASILNINGAAYMGPGMGVTTASTPTKITIGYNHVREYTRNLAALVCEPEGAFRTPEIADLSVPPNFSITPTPAGLSVYESQTGCAFLLPSAKPSRKAGVLETFHELVLPPWACKSLVARAQIAELSTVG